MRLQPIYDIATICASKGITDAVVCPGSRCAPLTLAFTSHPSIKTRTISDERSAGFIALGIAQQTSRTVVLICTSGTAAYNFAPAVAEAFYSGVPLLVLTADRPAEWIGQWDGQTIQQQNIYGGHVERFYQLPQDYDHGDARWSINRIVNESLTVCQTRKRPVHINVALREPLYPASGESIRFSEDIRVVDHTEGHTTIPARLLNSLTEDLASSTGTLVVGGQYPLDVNLISALNAFASSWAIPVVGDIISNLHPIPSAIRHVDAFLGAVDEQKKKELQPSLLITFGQSVISKNLKLFLRHFKAVVHWHIREDSLEITDPFQSVTRVISVAPELFFNLLSKGTATPERIRYQEKWQALESAAIAAVNGYFEVQPTGEFAIVNQMMTLIPDHSHLHLANSMSVRYANFATLRTNKKGVQVFSNRGTSGIDGSTSTAVGHSMASEQLHVLLTGDMAFFYDRNAFWNKYPVANLRVVVLNNHGGAIFGIIDGPAGLPQGDEYFITEQKLSAKSLADEFGFEYLSVTETTDVTSAFTEFFKPGDRTKIMEVQSDAKEAQQLFLKFKKKIKDTYAA